jgi:hypothetical protein
MDPETQREASNRSTPAPVPFGCQVSREANDDDPAPPADRALAPTSGDKAPERLVLFEERLAAALNRNMGPIDWTAARVRSDTPPSPGFSNAPYGEDRSTSNGNDWPALPEADTVKFTKLYFAHFHHRWPVLHAPGFEDETAPPVLLSCVIMIGAFIHGTSESKELAMNFQSRVLDYIFLQLVSLPPSGFQYQDHLTKT